MLKYFPLITFLFARVITFPQSPELILPTGHSLNIESVQFSPDNKYALSASWDKLAKLYEIQSGKEIRTFKGHRGYINSAVFSPDGKMVLTASWDSTAQLYDGNSGTLLFTLSGHQGYVNSAVFSPDGKKILTASWDGTAKIWNASNGQLLHTLTSNTGPIQTAVFSPDGKKAMFCSLLGNIHQFETETGTEINRIKAHNLMINTIRYSPDGKKILSSSLDSTARIFDATSGTQLQVLQGHKNNVFCAVFSDPNSDDTQGGKYVLTGSWDGNAHLYETETGKKVHTFLGDKAYISAAVISQDGKWVACGYYDNKVRVFDAKTSKVKCLYNKHKAMISDIQFDKTSTLLMSASFDNTIHAVNFSANLTVSIMDGHTQYVSNAVFSPKGDRFAVITSGALYIYATKTGHLLEKFSGSEYYGKKLIFHPNGEEIAIARFDYSTILVDAYSGNILHTYNGHKGYINDIQFSPDGKRIVTASYDSTVRVFDTQSEKQLFKSDKHKGLVSSARYSPDGKQIVTTCSDFTVRFLDASNGNVQKEWNRMPEYISAAEFSPKTAEDPNGGKNVLLMSYSRGFSLVESGTGNEVITYGNNIQYTINGHFNESGDRIVVCHDHYVQQFDAKTGKLLGDLQSHKNIINDAVYSPDGQFILTSGMDHMINMWDGTSEKPLWTMLHVNSSDQLIHDPHFRFDGTPGARELLYFVCGMEIIELDQVKEALYIPNLVERIMSKEDLNGLPKLSTIEICDVAPIVEPLDKNDGGFHFRILPRKGGLSGIEVYINGTLRETVPANTLKSNGKYMEYTVPSALIQTYSTSVSDANIKIIALTQQSVIHSRGITSGNTTSAKTPPVDKKPAIHAVMIGIDDYKGDGLDLNYASKDANDLEKVLKKATENFLNEGAENRVHFYNLTINRKGESGANGGIPDKQTILSTFRTIEKNCQPEDILFLFFAGHGELIDKKHLMLLTAEASKEEAPNFTGIAFSELLNFLKSAPANKRILILDACYSGAAINELGVGDMAGTRGVLQGEEGSNLTKDLDELASKSGLAILSASASDQKALELPQYEHGLLTYALLETFLHDTEVINDKNLVQLEDWLRKTEKAVTRIKESQEAQRFVPVNYSIGLVDESVRSLLVLREIPSIWIENVMNDDLKYDELDLRGSIIAQLKGHGTRSTQQDILLAEKRTEQAIGVNVLYTAQNNLISAKLMLIRNKKLVKEVTLQIKSSDPLEIAGQIVDKLTETIKQL
jgi:WD40 repeat protein/uncharacterized caspase-like protein